MVINFDKKEPKRRIRIKRDPYILSEEERQDRELRNKKKNKQHRKIKQELEEGYGIN